MTAELTLNEFDRVRAESVVLDVLPSSSFRNGHIPGAVSLPVDQITSLAALIVPDHRSRIVVYCASGICPHGPRAVSTLSEMGYQHVTLFPGGVEEWTASGRKLVRHLESATRSEGRHRVAQFVDSLTIRQWFSLWFAMILSCASMYWLGGLTPWPGLAQNGELIRSDWYGFADCLYFSVVTATTVGYGDIVPRSIWARALASTEAMGGMLLVGAVISRLLSAQQEKLLQDTHDLAFHERLGRMQTSLHLLIPEFQDLETLHLGGKIERSKIELRLSSGAMMLVRDLKIINELLTGRVGTADQGALELLLVTLNSALQAYLEVLSLVKSAPTQVTTQLSRVISEICSACMPAESIAEMKEILQRTELLAAQISKVHC
jgi:rhodanese-related sulfurtransferase